MGKVIKHTLRALIVLVVLFLAAAVLVPVFYKQQIMGLVQTGIDDHIDATVHFKDVGISLFRHFPHLSVRIKDMSITGKDTFVKDTLFSAPGIDISLDLVKAIKGDFDILKIDVVQPRIHAIVHADGKANWEVTKPAPAAKSNGPAKPFHMNLRKYAITNAFIDYRDEHGKMYATLENFSHEGSGNFRDEQFTLKTKTTADAITVVMGKIAYLKQVKTAIYFDMDVNSKTNTFSFSTKDIQINGLHLSASGSVRLPDTASTYVDITFSTPSNDFKDILSLVPGIYQNNFSEVKTTGTAALHGNVKGTYSRKQMPAFNLDLAIENGSFQYASLPQKVSDIQLKLAVHNPDGVIDHTEVNLEKGHLLVGAEPFDFHLLMRAPETSQWIDAHAKGHIDLSQLGQFMKLDKDTKITGNINADVSVKGSLLAAERKQLDSIDAQGTISIDHLEYASKDLPAAAAINTMLLTFSPEHVTVSDLNVRFLETTFTCTGSIDNLLSYYLHNSTLTGAIHIAGDKIDGNKWEHAFAPPKTAAAKPVAKADTKPFTAPANLNISLDASVDEIEYDHVKIKNVQGLMVLGDELINLKNVVAHALEGEVNIDGYYSTKTSKAEPDMSFEYVVSLGRLVVMRKHVGKEKKG